MAKPLSLTRKSLFFLYPKPKLMSSTSTTTTTLSLLPPLSKPKPKPMLSLSLSPSRLFSTTSTPYPLQYDMILNRPTQSSTRRQLTKPNSLENRNQNPEPEPGFESWVDQKLSLDDKTSKPNSDNVELDKSKRKYYNKRRKQMYGSDSDKESEKRDGGFVELKPQVVDFHRLHKREEELYFYDTFAFPWEKDKHYKMVYQLEKKYFPEQCLDKAFLEPGISNVRTDRRVKMNKKVGCKSGENENVGGESVVDNGLVFFEEGKSEKGVDLVKDVTRDVTEKKVEEFFKCLKKVPNKDGEVGTGEPYVVTRSNELPPRWDGPYGTVVLVNKPKGELISFFRKSCY